MITGRADRLWSGHTGRNVPELPLVLAKTRRRTVRWHGSSAEQPWLGRGLHPECGVRLTMS